MEKTTPLYVYVIGVAVVWAAILCDARFFGGGIHFKPLALLCAGFALGMLSMYIAVHLYKWR